MTWLGWLLGGGAGFGLALAVMLVRAPLSLGLAGLGAGAALVSLLLALTGDSFSRGFGVVYVGVGVLVAGVVAVPRALADAAIAASPARELVAWGLGAALVVLTLLAGLGLDRLLALSLPSAAKAQASYGLPGGLLLGALVGLVAGLLLRRAA